MPESITTDARRTRRVLSASVPVAVVGSLTLMLSTSPAHAADLQRQTDHQGAQARDALRSSDAVAPSSVRVPANVPPESYVVQPGDTVSAIAARHGLRTEDVLAVNGLGWSSSTIYPGQTLRLTAVAAPAPAPPAPVAPVPAAPAPVASGSYVVTAGDTISAIAAAHGVSINTLFSANGLGWSSIIYPGQSIIIPSAAPAMELAAATTPAPAAAEPVPPAAPAPSAPLDAEQISNAQVIIAVGREVGVSERGIAIALGTAMQESWLRNLDWGDRDSLGLFQQRPSTGWGTETEVRDAVRATRAFFGGPSDPNGYNTRGLLDIAGWEGMTFADAAQSVQISAYPDRYAQWEQPAYAWLAAHG